MTALQFKINLKIQTNNPTSHFKDNTDEMYDKLIWTYIKHEDCDILCYGTM
jgi:hypothetical protein